MRKFILVALVCVAILLAGCRQPGVPAPDVETGAAGSNFKVEFLFENEGTKLYRFNDSGVFVYYAVRPSGARTSWDTAQSNGKHTMTVPHAVDTVGADIR